MVKNKVRLRSLFFFVSFFFLVCAYCAFSHSKNVKSSYISKKGFLKTSKSRERSWRIRIDKMHFKQSTNQIQSLFISYFFLFFIYSISSYSISSLLLTLHYFPGSGPSKWCARYKVHGAELFWFILFFLLIRKKWIQIAIGESQWSPF